MSRKRSADPTTPIKITIPRSVLDAIHDEIGPSSSRSAWISVACRDKLLGSSDFKMADANLAQRWQAFRTTLHDEGVWVEPMMLNLVQEAVMRWREEQLTSSNPSEEP